MIEVWVLMPVAKKARAQEAYERWTKRGYRMIFFQDKGTLPWTSAPTIVDDYNGVWKATNALAYQAFRAGADVCLFAGDDMDPDPNFTAQEIAQQYVDRFPDGYGIMQPCGDIQGMDSSGKPAAARIAGSPWFGRGWARKAYGGRGPTLGDYYHFYGDEDLACVAEKNKVMWWRPDLTQLHRHWTWGWMDRQDYHKRNEWHWNSDHALFDKRKAEGFPE